jgi:hypothetical protein
MKSFQKNHKKSNFKPNSLTKEILTLTIFCKLLIDLFHSLHVVATSDDMIYHCQRVILSNDALCILLYLLAGNPGLVNEFCRKVLQNRKIFSNVVAIWISFSSEFHWAVTVEKLLKE